MARTTGSLTWLQRASMRRSVALGALGWLAWACVSRSRPEPEATSDQAASSARRAAEVASSPAASSPSVASGGPAAASEAQHQGALTVDERRTLLKLARSSLTHAVKNGTLDPTPVGLPSALTEKKGSFVTLTIKGELRGCIGNIFPDMPLAQAVIHNAKSAALEDTRFSPVTSDELSAIEVEVSVLSVPQPLKFSSPDDLMRRLRPHVDGVVLNFGLRRSTFLPQVWDQLPDPQDFLDHLSAKAGLARDAWRELGPRVMTYQVEAFKESE